MTDCLEPLRLANTFQIRRAQALCAHAPALLADLEAFMCTAPSYAQMDIYLKRLKTSIATDVAAALVGMAPQQNWR
ncbi:MAG: hypothetical protein JO278_15960 [Dyella sp.]|nr:hypothetical protein [Dyella sp.]